jgi:hypothetical protein
MTKEHLLPFQKLTGREWENLGILALLIFYIAQILLDIIWKNMCGNLAIDFCAFWSAGHVARTAGYASVYNLDLLSQIQRTLFPETALSSFVTVPVPYLPIFITPFQLFSLLKPNLGYWIWSIINLAIAILYIYFLIKQMGNGFPDKHILFLLLFSLPVFLNFYFGQINTWLMICTGEFLRAAITDKPIKAGIWLGGLLLKPQLLVLILPILLIQHSFKALTGFIISTTGIIASSFILAGFDGIAGLVSLWIGYVGGLPTNGPEIMMNWRMLGLNLSFFIPKNLSWVLAFTGLVITVIAALYMWRRPIIFTSSQFMIAMLGALAATNAISWHSHLSTAMIMIPVFAYLSCHDNLPVYGFRAWIFLPPLIKFVTFILALLISLMLLPANMTSLLNFAFGLTGLSLNLYFLWWSFAHNKNLENRENDRRFSYKINPT